MKILINRKDTAELSTCCRWSVRDGKLFNENTNRFEGVNGDVITFTKENGYFPFMEKSKYEERKARLKKEYEQNTKAPGSAENRIKEDSDVNPALAESATQFNDALLDEQAKKIKRLTKKIARLNKIIHKKNLKIEKLKTESSEHLAGEVKLHGETVDLSQNFCDKNEDIRLSKIREKNLTEVCQKYVKEVEDLRKQLANNVVDKIDAQALKSAESALAWKEKVIAEKDMALAYNEKEIAEKDEVIADLTHELKAKHKKYVWYKGAYDAAQQILNTIADYAAKHHDKKISDPMVEENHPTIDNPEEIEIEKAVKLVRKALEEGHTVSIDYDKAEEGGDQSATIVECGKDIDDVFEEIKRLCQE
jgi:hypothetical protein